MGCPSAVVVDPRVNVIASPKTTTPDAEAGGRQRLTCGRSGTWRRVAPGAGSGRGSARLYHAGGEALGLEHGGAVESGRWRCGERPDARQKVVCSDNASSSTADMRLVARRVNMLSGNSRRCR